MIQPARQSLEVLEWLPTKLHSGVSTLHYQELLAKEDNSPATRNAEFPLWGLRSDNSSASKLVKVATFEGKTQNAKTSELPPIFNWLLQAKITLHFWNYPKIKISRYLLTDGSNPPIQQDPLPYLHSNHRHCGCWIQSPSSTKHLRALFQETSKDTQRLAKQEIDLKHVETRLIYPG